ncbi:hypothetical protein GCM10011380_00250 [Sphingomonas metalli]|uniref:Recombinase RecT n=1 Tax=Sphingomonas metalli TaxID=1779358 RepID=A0A916SUN8_9SPHN|nr:recombinase RecT [Sphingomonas metalli]GGB14796.1 hypothetical protein GCM10011380_00250 [Sphingomonas metalli]
MATQLATRTASPVQVLRESLTAMAPSFKAALPAHISVEKFTRVAQTAITGNPELLDADRQTLFAACVRLAQDGLLPDGREAALVIFNAKDRATGGWAKKVQAMPMISGVLKKIRQSGDVAKVSAQVVCENDTFVWSLGFDETVTHTTPPLDQPRGRIIGAYATAVLKDGSQLLEVMNLEEIEKVRNVSRSKDKGPWVDWYAEMARKTVMRRLSKRLPMSTDVELFERDETLENEPQPATMRPVAPVSRLDALEQTLEGPADEQRGEVHSDDAEALIDAFRQADGEAAYSAAWKAFEVVRDGITDEDGARIREAAEEARQRVIA